MYGIDVFVLEKDLTLLFPVFFQSNYERLNQHVFFCSKRPSFIHYGIAKHYHLFLLHEDILVLLDALPYSHFSNRYWFFVQSSLIPVLITQLRILLPYPYTMEKDEVHRYLLIIIVMATAYKC